MTLHTDITSRADCMQIGLCTDPATLMNLRREVLADVFCIDTADPRFDAVMAANLDYYRRHLSDGSHYALTITEGRETCGCGAVCFYDEMPSPDNPTGLCGYLMNIYIRPVYRHRGLARMLVDRLVGECRRRGAGKIYLETTGAARRLYHTAGFRPMTDMMKL